MTIADFYQVVGMTKSGKSVKVRKIAKSSTDEFFGGEFHSSPVKGKFTGEVMTKRILDGDGFKVSDYSWAKIWDGVPMRENHWD